MNVRLVELVRLLAEIAVADYQKELWNKEHMLQQGKGGTVGSEERGSTEENAASTSKYHASCSSSMGD